MPDAITNVDVAVLRIQRRLRFAAYLTLGMAAATVILAAILVRRVGTAGAGLGWLAAQTLGSVPVAADLIAHRRGRSPRALLAAERSG